MSSEPSPFADSAPFIDTHCHLAWEECVPGDFIEGAVDNVFCCLAARRPDIDRDTVSKRAREALQDPMGDELIAFMQSSGIRQSWILVPDLTYALRPSRLTIEELLLHHRLVAERHRGKFLLFAGVDPRWGSDGIALFERAVTSWGYRGLKLYPPCGFSPSDRMLYPYFEICRQHRIPVLVHIGPTSPRLSFSTADPFLLDDACRDFPDVDFILGHGGSTYVDQSVMLCEFRPNVYLETSGFQRLGGLERWEAHLSSLFQRQINHKILFGTDWPVFKASIGELTAAIANGDGLFGDVTPRDLQLIMSGNAERIASRFRPIAGLDDPAERIREPQSELRENPC